MMGKPKERRLVDLSSSYRPLDEAAWSGLIMKITRPDWPSCRGLVTQVIELQGRLVAYVGFENLVLFITGFGDYDEFGLEEILHTLHRVFDESVGAKVRLDKSSVEKNFAKICLAIDEVIDFGQLGSLDVPHVMAQIKMKKPVLPG